MAQRVAVVGGVRTPFVKAGGAFGKYSMQAMGTHVLKEAVSRYKLDAASIDEFIFGTVLLDPRTPNWAREILFAAGLPKSVYAHAVSNNCISGLVAISDVAGRIAMGRTHLGLAGGTESMSNPSLLFSEKAARRFIALSKAKTVGDRLKVLSGFRPGDFVPAMPSVTEPSTGLTMGQHTEITAQKMGIPRAAQDEIALKSHLNAARAAKEGIGAEFIAPLGDQNADGLIRGDTTAEKLAALKPVFDRTGKGTLTAGNSSALTDGASVVILMSEERAKKEGREILAYVKDYEYAALSPDDGLLMAPALAVPRMLKRNNLTPDDFDRIEIHEAFAAQVESNIRAWEEGWKEPATGKIPRDRLNVNGGSIALGHPFAATGGRMVLGLAHELKRLSLKRGFISICAAGGLGGAMILERD